MRIFTSLLSCLIALNSTPVLADQTAEYQQCAVDLCGPASNYSRILARGTFGFANSESKAFIKGSLDPVLDQAFAVTLKNKALAAAFADKNAKLTDLSMNDEQRAFLTTLTYMSSLSKIFGEILKSSDGRGYQIDKEKLKAKVPTLTSEQVDSYAIVLNTLFATNYFQTAMVLDSVSYDNLIIAWGPQAELNILNLKGSLSKVLSLLGYGIKQKMYPEVLDKAFLNKNSLTDAEKKFFITTIATIYRAFGMTDASVIAVTKPINMQLSDAARLLNWSDKNKKLQQAFATKKQIASSKHSVRKQCHDAWAQSLATAPSELRQRQSDKLLAQVKAAGKRVLPRYATDEALARANEAVDKMTFSKPLSLPQIKGQLTDSITASLIENKKFEADLASATTQDIVGYTILAMSGPMDEANIFESIQNECSGMAPRNFVDAAYRQTNSILTSWQSTLFPEVGVGVLAHELGHIVSYAISAASQANQQGYTNSRACAIEKHALLEQYPEVTKFKQYVEEDWADLFAGDVILEIEKSWPYSANYACSLLDTEKKNEKFSNLKLFDPQGVDTHSTSFLRALQIQTALKRPLPASCVQALKPHEKTVIERSCSQ